MGFERNWNIRNNNHTDERKEIGGSLKEIGIMGIITMRTKENYSNYSNFFQFIIPFSSISVIRGKIKEYE
jgi:hypothetical protein